MGVTGHLEMLTYSGQLKKWFGLAQKIGIIRACNVAD